MSNITVNPAITHQPNLHGSVFSQHQHGRSAVQNRIREDREIHPSVFFYRNDIDPVFFPYVDLSDRHSDPRLRQLHFKDRMLGVQLDVIQNVV